MHVYARGYYSIHVYTANKYHRRNVLPVSHIAWTFEWLRGKVIQVQNSLFSV